MRGLMLRVIGLAVVAAVGVATGAPRASLAQQGQSVTFPLAVVMGGEPGRRGGDPGLTAQVTLTLVGDTMMRTQVRVTGLGPNDERAAHIHKGVCDPNVDGPITHQFNPVQSDASGVGASDTLVDIGSRALETQSYVQVHERAAPPGFGVLCANIPTSFTAMASRQSVAARAAAGGKGQRLPIALPNTGDGSCEDDSCGE